MSNVKIILFVIALILPGCFNIADINWREELANTHWSDCNTNAQFVARMSHPKSLEQGYYFANYRASNTRLQGQGYDFINDKIVPFTVLNEDGLRIMETEGCFGCHKDGGDRPTKLPVKMFIKSELSQPAYLFALKKS